MLIKQKSSGKSSWGKRTKTNRKNGITRSKSVRAGLIGGFRGAMNLNAKDLAMRLKLAFAQGDCRPFRSWLTLLLVLVGVTLAPSAFAQNPPTFDTVSPPDSVDEESIYTYNVEVSDIDGDALTLSAPTIPGWLTFTPSDNGTPAASAVLSGTPDDAELAGSPYDITLRVHDDDDNVDVDQDFTITVNPVNDAPVAAAISDIDFDEDLTDSSLDLDDYVDDVDNTDAELTWTFSGNTDVTVSIDAGTHVVTFGATQHWSGTETITFRATDPGSEFDETTVAVTVNPDNDAPVTDAIPPIDFDEDLTDSSLDLDDYVDDVDNTDAELTWTFSGNTDVTVSIDAGTHVVTFGATQHWNGTETITFRATDPGSEFDETTVVVTVNPVNDQPSATNLDQLVTYTEGDFGVAFEDIEVTDVDTDEQITATLTLADPAAGALTTAGGGSYTAGTGVWTITDIVGTVNNALETVAFEPADNHDTDTTVAVLIADGEEDGSVPLTGTITLDVDPVNDQPEATNLDQTHDYVEDDATLALDDIEVTDVDTGEEITATLTLADPDAGTLTTTGGGSFTAGEWTIIDSVDNVNTALAAVAFEPAQDYDENTTVGVTIADGGENGSVALTGTITLNVTPVNDAPVTPDFDQSTDEDSVLTIDLLSFASDVDSDLSPPWSRTPADDTVSVEVTQGQLGSVNINVVTGEIIYTPFADEHGDDSFSYRVRDGELASTGEVSVTVTSVNDAPFAGNDAESITPGEPAISIDVLANDGDPDSNLDPSTVQIVPGQGPEYGTAVPDPDTGMITYTLGDTLPDDFVDTFMYQVSDDDDTNPLSATATVTILISPASFVVDSLVDEKDDDPSEGNLSLREAIAFIMDGGVIEFDPDLFDGGQQTIILQETGDDSSADLVIDKSMTIRGPGADLLIISGSNSSRVFAVESGTVIIEGLTVADGRVADGEGGGIRVGSGATLELLNCRVSDNESADENDEQDDRGGGIFNSGSLTLIGCTVSGNTAAASGGGIYSDGALGMVNSTISGNSATDVDGGGILAAGGSVLMTNCTITNNTAVSGGGLSSEQSGITTIGNSIIVGNSASGAPDVQGIVNSNGHNLVGDGEGSAESFGEDEVGIEAASLIDVVLRDNGGRLPTHSILADSAAIDAGDDIMVPEGITTDQRGGDFDRIQGLAVDIGAYEVRQFVVNTLDDTDDVNSDGVDTSPDSLSLREAVALTFPGDSIIFDVGGPDAQITLDGGIGELIVDSNLAIVGPGADQLTISGGEATQILYIPAVDVDVVISGLTFEDAYDDERGGAVIYSFGTVRISDCIFSNNTVDGFDGGAIHNRGFMTLTDCTLRENTADNLGGAIICWNGTLTLNECTLTDNEASQMGGAIFNMLGGTVTMDYCTLSGNNASLNGGAIYNSATSTMTLSGCTLAGNTASSDAGGILNSGTLTLTNSTISGNTAGRNGGGLLQVNTTATLTNCTVTTNVADNVGNGFAEGGGICQTGGVLYLYNTIVAGNFDTVDNSGMGNKYPDVSGTVMSLGANIVGDGNGVTGIVGDLNGDMVGTSSEPINPLLGALADNGGATQTHALGVRSPAIDAGDDEAIVMPVFAGPPFVEQRGQGYIRMLDGDGDGDIHVDIGAVEFATAPPVFSSMPVILAGEDLLYSYGVTVIDDDADDLLTITATDLPAWLDLVDNGDGTATLSGTPANEDVGAPYDIGQYSIVLEVTDWAGGTATQEFAIQVIGVNDAPTPGDDDVSTNEDLVLSIDVLANDSDIDGGLDPSTVRVVAGQEPRHGSATVDVATGAIVYDPDPNFNGVDSFVYEVSDDGTPLPALAATATVTVTVDAVNDEPSAVDDLAITEEDSSVVVDVLDNDSDLDGNLNPELVIVSVAPSNGTTGVDVETGAVTYVPNPDFYGTDIFSYRVFDDGSPLPPLSSDATVTVTVMPVNDPPRPADDSAVTLEDIAVTIDVLLNDLRIDGNLVPDSVTVVSGPSNGTTSVDPVTGAVTYTPSLDYVGTDVFVYEVSDDGTPLPGLSATATVSITVNAVNDPPVAEDDVAYTLTDEPVTIDVLGNDDDVDGNLIPDSVTVVDGPSEGLISVDPDTGIITYKPNPDYTGTDTFIYEVSDDGAPLPALSSVATVTVETAGPPGPPQTYYVDAANGEAGDGSRDNPFSTIGDAVSATRSFRDDTIYVLPGEYVENVQLKPETNLVSADGAFHTTILAPAAKAVYEVLTAADRCVVRGFTISQAPTAVRLPAGVTAELTNCVFHSCDVGVYAGIDSQLILNNNTIYGNRSSGVFADDDATLLSLNNNIFVANDVGILAVSATGVGGGYNILFDNGQDYIGIEPLETDFKDDPLFVNELSFNFHLRLSSPARDGGDPGQNFLDPDGTRNDIGADGGPSGVTDDLLPVPVIVTEPRHRLAFGDPPFTVLFDGSGSNDEWGIASYSWDFDAMDGFQEDAFGPEVQHTFDQAGTFTVTLQVADNNNLVNSATIEVVVGEPPVVDVTALPAAGAVPLVVQFTTDAFDPDGGQLTYSWDFTASGQIDSISADPQHTYLDDGGYVPSVTVSDDEGAITRATLPVTGTVWPVQGAEQVDGAAGGTVVVSEVSSSLHEAAIDMPAGALSGTKVVTIGAADNPPASDGDVFVVTVETGPAGTRFSHNVTVTVPLPAHFSDDKSFDVRGFDVETQTWSTAGIKHVRRVESSSGRAAQFQTNHLGLFTVVVSLAADIDGSGEVDVADVQLVINAALGIDIGSRNADVDVDGDVDATDIQLLINAVLGATG